MKHTITICMGSSCFARGNKRNLKIIEEYLARYKIDCALNGRGCVGRCVPARTSRSTAKHSSRSTPKP